ncbi:MAG: sulfatase-like hydrolase/transferase [Sedimentisphaerales bacterium]|nr:sulfatase-like hydrolase/transferase [Sedimentisphaerales bacterium]
MNRRTFLQVMGVSAVVTTTGCQGSVLGEATVDVTFTPQRPNVLWISLEDISPDLGCYGDDYAITPHIDRLAEQGTRFDRAFTSHGVCAPVRSGMIMSYYASAAGTNPMRCKGVPPESIRCFPEYMRQAGYYCTNNAKTDYQFDPPDTAWDESSNRAHWRNRPAGKPFFCVINLTSTHESQIRTPNGKKATLHDPARAKLPPYYPDTPLVRNDWACYHDNLTQTDARVGQILKDLEADGLAEDTVVWFWGDHGRGLPRAKRWIYDSGLHIPLIIRAPAKYRDWASPKNPNALLPGSVNKDLVSSIDFGATMLSLAGIRVPPHMHGRPFLGPQKASPRKYIYGARDRIDETHDLMRCVRDETFHYIRNYMPYVPRSMHVAYMDLMPTMQEMRRLHAEGKLTGAQKQYFEHPRPVEELYDTVADPHEIHNLANDPNYGDVLKRLRDEMHRWIREIGDVGLIPEPDFDMMKRPLDRYEATAMPGVKVQSVSAQNATSTVILECLTPGSSIAYRLDGPNGTHQGTQWEVYTTPVIVARGQTLRAKGVRIGFRDSKEVRFQNGDPSIAPEKDPSREHWEKQLARTDLLDRLLEVKELDLEGEAAREKYFALLGDKWGPVRYWAVLGLHHSCKEQAAIERAGKALMPLLLDTSQSVPVAAAEALCDWDQQEIALPALLKALQEGYVEQTKLFAAHSFYRLGTKAKDALSEVKKEFQNASGDLKKVLERAVKAMEA